VWGWGRSAGGGGDWCPAGWVAGGRKGGAGVVGRGVGCGGLRYVHEGRFSSGGVGGCLVSGGRGFGEAGGVGQDYKGV
jgi:hypothetical protein